MIEPIFRCLGCNAEIRLTESLAALLTQLIEENWDSSSELRLCKQLMQQRRLEEVKKINELPEQRRLKNLKESIRRMEG